MLADRVGGFVPEGGQLVGVGRTVLFAAEGEALLHQANLRFPMRQFKRRLDTRLEVYIGAGKAEVVDAYPQVVIGYDEGIGLAFAHRPEDGFGFGQPADHRRNDKALDLTHLFADEGLVLSFEK